MQGEGCGSSRKGAFLQGWHLEGFVDKAVWSWA